MALAVSTLASCGLGTTTRSFVDEVSFVEFHGQRFSGGPANGYDIDFGDLTPLGPVERVQSGVIGEAYRLDGVPPDKVIVMRAASPDEGVYWILFAPDSLDRDPGAAPLQRVPELCAYVAGPSLLDRCPGLGNDSKQAAYPRSSTLTSSAS